MKFFPDEEEIENNPEIDTTIISKFGSVRKRQWQQ